MIELARRTKIIATLGPATDAPGVLEAMLRAGVDVVRLNFSHGDHASQAARARAVRETAARVGREVGIVADLQGPKIRIERFAAGRVSLRAGDPFTLVASNSAPPGDATQVGVSYLGLVDDLRPGDTLLLDDGLMQLTVERIEGERIHTQVINDGDLSDRKGLNRLGGGLSLGALTDKDRADIVKTIDAKVLGGQPVEFRSTAVRSADDRLEIDGELTLAGSTRPVSAALEIGAGSRVSGTIPLTQTAWGIKPYRGLMGALKVRDDVEIVIDAQLGSG